MFTGLVERKIDSFYETPVVMVRLYRNGQEWITTKITGVKAGCIQFSIPMENGIADGEELDIQLDLPLFGQLVIKTELKKVGFGVDPDFSRIQCCEAKLMGLSPELWSAVWDYFSEIPASDPGKRRAAPKERQDVRVDTLILAEIALDNGVVIQSLIEDIGFGGVRLRLPMAIPENRAIQVAIPNETKPLIMQGITLWTKKVAVDIHEYYVGVRFKELDLTTYTLLRELIYKRACMRELTA